MELPKINARLANPSSAVGTVPRVLVTDYGARPDSRDNAVVAVRMALDACRKEPGATLVFPKGRYDFWPDPCIRRVCHESNTHDLNPKTCAMVIEGFESLTVDGGGSLFVFHGQMQPFTVDRCRGIAIRNLRIDWDVPLTAQARVADADEHLLDLLINEESPYVIEDGQLVFVGEGWKSSWWGTIEFDPVRRIVAPQSGDECFGGTGTTRPQNSGAAWFVWRTDSNAFRRKAAC